MSCETKRNFIVPCSSSTAVLYRDHAAGLQPRCDYTQLSQITPNLIVSTRQMWVIFLEFIFETEILAITELEEG